MNTIAIDCGASFIKVAYMIDENIVEKTMYDTSAQYDIPIREKRDNMLPEKLRDIIKIVREMIYKYAADNKEICLGICNEMHGFVITDQDFVPCMDYISWQKEYILENYSDEITWKKKIEDFLDKAEIRNTGMPFKAGLPSGNLFYLMNKGFLKQDKKYFFFSLGDFIYAWLFEAIVPMHPTNAAGTGLYDICNSTWSKRLIQQLGLQNISFPPVEKGKKLYEFMLYGATIKTLPALGDQQASLLGAGFCSENQISVNMGTGAQVSVMSSTLELSDNYQTRPYFNGMFLHTIPHIPSGRAVNVYYRFVEKIISDYMGDKGVSKEKIWGLINSEVNLAREFEMDEFPSVDLSFFSNAITERTTGKIDNITEKNFSLGSLFKSVYHQMAINVLLCIGRVYGDIKKDEIIFSGGLIKKNKYLRDEIMSKFKDCSCRISDCETFYGIQKYMRNIEG